MPGIGIGIGVPFRKVFGNIPPSILSDGNTVAWYDYSDIDTIDKDINNRVASWRDKLGSGHDLLQSVLEYRPLYKDRGIYFDGANDYLKTAAFTLNQPEHIYAVIKQVRWFGGDYIFDGETTADGSLLQTGVSPGLKVYAGTNSSENVNLPINKYGVLKILFNGASSKFQIDETAAISGDFGAINMGGFTLGRKGLGGGEPTIEVKEIIIRKIADTIINENLIYSYLKKKHKISELIYLGIIGDSISAPDRGYWPLNIPLIYDVSNKALSGKTIMADMDGQTDAAVIDNNEVVIIELGTNDDNSGDMVALQAKVESNIIKLKAGNPNITIYYMNVLPRWTNVSGAVINDKSNIRAAISAACAAQSIECWDTFTDPWILPSDTQDGTHPTVAGGVKIWNKIKERI